MYKILKVPSKETEKVWDKPNAFHVPLVPPEGVLVPYKNGEIYSFLETTIINDLNTGLKTATQKFTVCAGDELYDNVIKENKKIAREKKNYDALISNHNHDLSDGRSRNSYLRTRDYHAITYLFTTIVPPEDLI